MLCWLHSDGVCLGLAVSGRGCCRVRLVGLIRFFLSGSVSFNHIQVIDVARPTSLTLWCSPIPRLIYDLGFIGYVPIAVSKSASRVFAMLRPSFPPYLLCYTVSEETWRDSAIDWHARLMLGPE